MAKCQNCGATTRVAHHLFPRKEVLCAECLARRVEAKVMCESLRKAPAAAK